jgi:probable phosphoglycerate mutase
VVGHDSVNRALLLACLDLPPAAYWRFAQEPCCLNVIELSGAAVTIRSINETQHLEAMTAQPVSP